MPADAYNEPLTDPALVACLDCDLVQRLPDLDVGASARCPRCNREIWRRRERSLERTLALGLAAAVLYVVANAVPMLDLTAVGHRASTTVVGGAQQLWADGRTLVALLVFCTAVLAPGAQIVLTLAVVFGARRPRPRPWVARLLRHHPTTVLWSMIEVMIIGVLVALIKIADYATVVPGTGLFALGALVFLLAGMQASLDRRAIWQRVEWVEQAAQPAAHAIEATA